MPDVITQTVAPRTEQRAEDVGAHNPALRRIRHRHHARQIAQLLGPSDASGSERRRRMAEFASRFHDRASMLLVADVRIGCEPAERAVVRNISAAGLMVELDEAPARGEFVSLNLGDIGWINGTVIWKVGNRFGVRFDEEIDPGKIRRPVAATPLYRPSLARPIF
jgi:hypothetical protein